MSYSAPVLSNKACVVVGVGGRSHDARLDLLVGYGEQVDLNKKVRIRQAGDSNHRARRRFVRIEELRQLGILQRLDEFVYVNDEVRRKTTSSQPAPAALS
jgi:hypothetical protein